MSLTCNHGNRLHAVIRRLRWLGLLSLLVAGSALAAEHAFSGLPPEDVVLRAIDATPEVRAAEARVDRATAEVRMRDVGSHETTLGATGQRRRVEGDRSYPEWELNLSRTLRLPAKARLDHEIGEQGLAAARFGLEDARHAAARRVLAGWLAWQRAGVERFAAEALAGAAERDLQVATRRVQLGAAARQDEVAAKAAAAQAGAALQRARAAETQASLALQGDFPGLVLPARVLPEGFVPPELSGSDSDWIETIIARSHEIDASDALLQQKRAEARRAQADRVPDPTVGVRALHEFGGREQAYGFVFSVPLSGAYRGAVAAAASADAAMADSGLAATRRDVARDARQVVAAARAVRGIWVGERQALAAASERARLAARAYALGEAGITELVAARRMQQEATQAEARAALDALEAVARVWVDAHELWHRADHDDERPSQQPGLPEL
ncbi:MAG: TolC family protein [Proteobacteria bacterium]|nr:TolC family protein [Pseudomonadota bacterium]